MHYVSKAKIHYEYIMRSKENRKTNNEYTIIILPSPSHVFIKKTFHLKILLFTTPQYYIKFKCTYSKKCHLNSFI